MPVNLNIPPESSPHHKAIVKSHPIPGTHSGRRCILECGHEVFIFGAEIALVYCTRCQRDSETANPSLK